MSEPTVALNNIGPIRDAKILIKPLTILIGKNNSGKSYAATSFKATRDLMRWHLRKSHFADAFDIYYYTLDRFSDRLREVNTKRFAAYSEKLLSVLEQESKRNFDAAGLRRFIQTFGASTDREIIRWGCEEGSISVDAGHLAASIHLGQSRIESRPSFSKEKYMKYLKSGKLRPERLLGLGFDDVHYLPASRSGVVQSYRVVAANLINEAGYIPLHGAKIPSVNPLTAEFLSKLVRIGPTPPRQNPVLKDPRSVANQIEQSVLEGRVSVKRRERFLTDFEFVKGAHRLNLVRASSSIGELAPLVLFLRYYVSPNELLIIEEPEAHLHPANIAKVARLLCVLVNCNVSVMVTTHSDFFLSQISNLVKASSLPAEKLERAKLGRGEAILPSAVSGYLFKMGRDGSVATSMKVDNEGISVEDFNDVADEIQDQRELLSY